MPSLELLGRRIEARTGTLTPRQAAEVLQVELREVRNDLRRRAQGSLTPAWAGRERRVRADEVAERVKDNPLAFELLVALLEDPASTDAQTYRSLVVSGSAT